MTDEQTTIEVGASAPRVILAHAKDGTPFLSHFIGLNGEDLTVHTVDEEEHQPFPRRPHGSRSVSELESFLAELARRPLGDTGTLWGTADKGRLTAIYNDHDPEPHIGGWRDDQLTLQLKPDPDWLAWHNLSGKPHQQEAFGDLVEELLHTVVRPDQADLLEIIDSVRASSKGQFESSITRANGAQRVTFNTEVTATAGRTDQLEVPQTITLRLRPWEGHPTTYDVDAYFRLRIENGRLFLLIKLKPTRQIIRAAWDEITATVQQTIAKPVYATA